MQVLREVYLRQATCPDHDEHWSGPPEMVERIAGVVGTRAGVRVLDVGCGLGGPARRLASLTGCAVVGVDLLPAVLSVAAVRTSSADVWPGDVVLTAGTAEALPFPPGCFDQAWCLGVVAHLAEERRFVSEVWRVLKRDGMLAVTEAFWDGRREPRFAATAPAPWRPVTVEALTDALRAVGMDDVRVLPWPGEAYQSREQVRDDALRADLLDGRLRTHLVVGHKP